MLVAGHDEVEVDLVADHQHVVLQADIAHAAQLLLGPHPSHRVVGGAEDEHLAVLGLLLEVIQIHLIAAVCQLEGALHDGAPVHIHRPVEGVVDRGEQQHLAAGPGEGPDGGVQPLDHAVGLNDPILLDLPVMAGGHPVLHRVGVRLAPPGVAPHAELGGLFQLLDDLGRGEQFHVGHGQGDHAGGGVGSEGVPLSGLHADAGVSGIELIFHCGFAPFLCSGVEHKGAAVLGRPPVRTGSIIRQRRGAS